MDAVKFVEERNRMCDFYKLRCTSCPLEGKQCTLFRGLDVKYTVAAVEAWSIAHPVKTRQSVFLSHYPNAEVDEDGVLKVCPKVVEGSGYINSSTCGCMPCAACHKAYWSVAVKETE